MSRHQINADDLHTLYVLIGKAIWLLQHVEDALSTAITIKHEIKTRGSMSAAQAEAILAKHRGNTLGTSLRISWETGLFAAQLQGRLDKFREERDWLVHRSVHQNGADLYEDDKRLKVMCRIEAFSEEALALQKAVESDLEQFGEAQGLKKEWVLAHAQQQIKKLRGA
jgi:hypothetical protein